MPPPDAFVSGFAPAFDSLDLILRAGSFDELKVMDAPLNLVPEPSTFFVGLAGFAGLGLVTLRKKFRRA